MVAGLFTGLPETIKIRSDGSTPASSTMLPSAPQVCVVWGKIGKSRATGGPYSANKLLWVVDVLVRGNAPILPGAPALYEVHPPQTCPCVFGSILKWNLCVCLKVVGWPHRCTSQVPSKEKKALIRYTILLYCIWPLNFCNHKSR